MWRRRRDRPSVLQRELTKAQPVGAQEPRELVAGDLPRGPNGATAAPHGGGAHERRPPCADDEGGEGPWRLPRGQLARSPSPSHGRVELERVAREGIEDAGRGQAGRKALHDDPDPVALDVKGLER